MRLVTRVGRRAGLALIGLLALGQAPQAQDGRTSAALLKEFVWRPIGPVNIGGCVDDLEAVESNPAVIK